MYFFNNNYEGEDSKMAAAPAASCISTEHGCVMFDCLVHLWEWLDPPASQDQFPMENKKTAPATQQPITQQHIMAQHVHPDQIYSPQHPQITTYLNSAQPNQIQPNGVMHQLLQSQYQSNMNARSPLLENRHEVYGTGHNHEYARHYGTNDNYNNYPQSPIRTERTDLPPDQNVNHEILHNVPKGYNAEVYHDYLKRNPPKDSNQIYQNHQPMYRPNVNQYGSKPYLPYSNRIGPQSNTELLRKQYNEIQQMKMQQQLHYQNQAQMHQQQKFAERQLLLQQIHGVQPPPNLQNSIYSDGSYRDLDRYSSKHDFKDYSMTDIQKETDRYAKNNEYKEMERQNRQFQEAQWQANQAADAREIERYRKQLDEDKAKNQSPPSDFSNQSQKNSTGVMSPMKSSESSTPSIKSPSSESRRNSGGNQALRSPIAQRIPSAPVTIAGILYKQGSDGLKVWRKRWFVLAEYCLFYYKSQDEEKLLGSVLLPSYKVSACTVEDKVMRKFAFKLEHANMRTYVLAALDQEAMLKWVKALTMAALMQGQTEQPQKQNDRPAAKTEDSDEVPGPTYANAPPKPRRSNDGYNSPSPDMYDPNYDLLKKPASHYSQGTNHTRYQDHMNYQSSTNMESTYTRSPQSPSLQQSQYQTKRSYDTHHLSLPLTNTNTDNLENQSSSLLMYKSNPQSPYFDNRNRNQQDQKATPNTPKEQVYDRQPQRNPFLQDFSPPMDISPKTNEVQGKKNRQVTEQDTPKQNYNESYPESRTNTLSHADQSAYNKDVYGELNVRSTRTISNDRITERRTPDAYGRSTTATGYGKGKLGDYEDVYNAYTADADNTKNYPKSPNASQSRDNISISSHKQAQDHITNPVPEKHFSGPSVLRRKKMQSSGIQPPMPRPHSADFLEYESKNEALNKTMPVRNVAPPKQPQRPKSSLDINSYYDPSSDRYYSEESYAEKMRQSAQYLQQQQKQAIGPRNIQIPLAKYASGLAEKQLNSPYSQVTNNNYETEFTLNRNNRDNVSYHSKYSDLEGLNSNWTLREKALETQKEHLNRSGSVMSDGSNVSAYVKEMSRLEQNPDSFMRSASARLPSTNNEREGEKKVQQREESMKRLLEWKQRMLQSPLTRKSTPAAISLARSLNQSRQSLRSEQYKSKTYTNASYNSYSSDDEEETSDTDLQKPRDMQAGRSHNVNITSPIVMRPTTPHAHCVLQSDDRTNINSDSGEKNTQEPIENTYENILCTISIPKLHCENEEDDCDIPELEDLHLSKSVAELDSQDIKLTDGYETHDSESESETQLEYTDYDLDEVLLQSDNEVDIRKKSHEMQASENQDTNNSMKAEVDKVDDIESETPPLQQLGEDHYLPMSPRKTSIIEPAHKTILKSLSNFGNSALHHYEDNPYVEMNLGNDEEDMQTYEIVCVNNGKVEPVYMELNNITEKDEKESEDVVTKSKFLSDTVSNFAETKDQTVKRASKTDKSVKDKLDSDVDDECIQDSSLVDAPYSRFSISDTFRPASYYLSGSRTILERQDSSDSDIVPPPPVPDTSPADHELSAEALSKYILDKLDKSDIPQDNSILKMLTSENQKMNFGKKKATSLMIYGSKTSIHDTLSRGEKVRNSRASLVNDKNRISTSSNCLHDSIQELQNCSSIETDSLQSYNADRGSSRLSIESDLSSKFEMAVSNISSDINSLRDSGSIVDLRHSSYRDLENMLKRRPLSDDSLFEFTSTDMQTSNEEGFNKEISRYLEISQPSTSEVLCSGNYENSQTCLPQLESIFHCDNSSRNYLSIDTQLHCSSSPINNSIKNDSIENKKASPINRMNPQISAYVDSQSPCSSIGMAKSPISFYSKNNEGTLLRKNLNNEILSDKIKEFECDKSALKTGNETNVSSSTTGFHSRESSAEHSAPYYYSDLSSQEHINVLPTSHFLKNTNLHRKLNNQRRKGPLHKKNEISHIHNPIRNNQVLMSDRSYEFASSARSVSVEFLSAAEKDPDIDLKNIYESTGFKGSKIPESINLIPGLGCKRSCNINNSEGNSSPDSNSIHRSNLNVSSTMKVSTGSMSSHCSGNSSNTVYYDAEAEASAYENVICPGEKHWDEDALWRDNLRRVSHRHARSMDDLDARPSDPSMSDRSGTDKSCLNSIKRVKKNIVGKISRTPTYINCDIQSEIQRRRENSINYDCTFNEENEKLDENDVYVSLANTTDVPHEQSDEGVYEQLTIESSENSLVLDTGNNQHRKKEKDRKQFEIDREKLRQWDLMSSGLMKGGAGCVRGAGVGMGTTDALCSTDTRKDNASNEASMSMSGTNIESGTTNNTQNQQSLSKKAFLGSNTSIGRSNREGNIPVRAVSPRVRWVEDKSTNDPYGTQQIMTSQQNIHALSTNEETWARSPSRAMQQPIRAVSPRVRRNTENEELPKEVQQSGQEVEEVPTAGELLGRSHEELVLLLIQLRRRHAATHRSIEQCCAQINSIEDCLSSLKAMEREESLQRLEQLKMQLMDLEHQYEKSKPLVQLVDNMVKLGSLYNRPGSTVERLERNQRLRQKVLAEHALEQQRWLESAAAGKPLETEAARVRVAELWALEQELADEAAILQGLKTDKDAIESLLTGVRGKLDSVNRAEQRTARSSGDALEAELARVHAMLAHNSKKLEQTVADNARLERELQQLRRALQARRAAPQHALPHPAHATALLEDEVSRVQQLVSALQRQRQELSRAVRHLTQQSQALQITHDSMPGKRRPTSSWQETNLDTGHTIDHGYSEYDYDITGQVLPPGHYGQTNVETPLYVDTRPTGNDITSPLTSEDLQHSAFGNLSNVEKQEIKTVRIVKRESERRQRDRERSLQPMTDWTTNNITANLDQFLEEELVQPINYARASSVPRTDFSKFEEYYTKPQPPENPTYLRLNDKNIDLSPKYPSSPSLSNYDYSRDISSLSSSYHKSYDRSGYDKTMSLSTQYLNSPTDSSRTLTNDPISKTSSIASLTRSHMELSPIFKSEAAKQIITEMSGDGPKNGSLHRRQVPKEKRRHYTAPHHLSAKTLNEIPKDTYNQDAMGRSLDDADMERALRGAAPDVVRSALPARRPDSIDQLLAAPQKIVIPERYIPEKPPELSPEEQQKRQEKVESIKKMLTSSSADPNKSPDGEEKRQREHLLQMNQILAKQVTEMSKIIAVKALEELPAQNNMDDYDDRSPDVELPIYQQRDNFFT